MVFHELCTDSKLGAEPPSLAAVAPVQQRAVCTRTAADWLLISQGEIGLVTNRPFEHASTEHAALPRSYLKDVTLAGSGPG